MPVQAPSAPQGPARFPGPCIKRCPGGCNCPGEQAGLERPQRQWYEQSTKAQTQSFPLKIQTQVTLINVKQLIRHRLPEAALRPTSSMPYTLGKTSSFTGNAAGPQPSPKHQAETHRFGARFYLQSKRGTLAKA